MVGLTHAIGGATTVLWVNYLAPQYFPLSIWILIMSFYIGQGPDIDIKKSSITKNIYIKIFIFWLLPFIDGHRAKQTHSFFWCLVYAFLSIPFMYLFGTGGWLALVLAYFSHLFLDFFNPTGVRLFYIPFLNAEPRSWSLYNTIPHLASEIPYFLKKLWYINDRNKRRNIKRKQIKYDGVWVLTGSWMEKTISLLLWILFIILLVLQLKVIKDAIFTDTYLLTLLFPLYVLIVFSLVSKNKDLIRKNIRIFKYFLSLSVILVFLTYLGGEGKYIDVLRDSSIFWFFIFISSITLIPLLYLLSKKFYNSVIQSPGYLLGKAWDPDIYDYSVFTQLLLILLLVFSIPHIPEVEANTKNFIQYYQEKEDKKEILTDTYVLVKDLYTKGIEDTKTQIQEEIIKRQWTE